MNAASVSSNERLDGRANVLPQPIFDRLRAGLVAQWRWRGHVVRFMAWSPRRLQPPKGVLDSPGDHAAFKFPPPSRRDSSRQTARHMQRARHRCGRHRVRRLMRLMRLGPICSSPRPVDAGLPSRAGPCGPVGPRAPTALERRQAETGANLEDGTARHISPDPRGHVCRARERTGRRRAGNLARGHVGAKAEDAGGDSIGRQDGPDGLGDVGPRRGSQGFEGHRPLKRRVSAGAVSTRGEQ